MYEDLMRLAEHIATLDPGKPKQAHLRRSISTAYYALFHFLVDQVCCAQIGTQNAQRPYRHSLGRALIHTVMKQACVSFGGGVLKASVIKGLPRNQQGNYAIPSAIQNISAIFVELQEKRHMADYDLSERFKRSEVLWLINETRQHVKDFQELPTSDDRKFFLACLWAWKELSNR